MEKSLLKADLLRSMGLILEQAECFYMIFSSNNWKCVVASPGLDTGHLDSYCAVLTLEWSWEGFSWLSHFSHQHKQWAGGLWPKIFLLSKNILKVWALAAPPALLYWLMGPNPLLAPPHRPWAGSMDSECRFDPCCAYFWMFNNKSNKYGKLANKNRVIIPRLNDIPMQKHITLNIKQNLEEGTDFDPYLAHCPFLWVLVVLRPLKL